MPGMTRRRFVATAASACSAAVGVRGGARADAFQRKTSAPVPAGSVITVRGPVPPDELGRTLVHEHVLVDFVSADEVSPSRYDRDAVFRLVLPFLRDVRARGVKTFVECTPAYLGRDPQLLLRLAQAADLHIVTNTGLYGAANDRFIPATAYAEDAEALAADWTREFTDGIDGTDVRPGFMKIGVDAGRLSEIDAKLVEAAGLTHRATGLPIAAHTGDGTAAHHEMDLLAALDVPLDAFIWVHAQNERDVPVILQGARRGAWISFDGVSPASLERHLSLVNALADAGQLDRVLLSHDAGWYRVGEPGGGDYRPHTAVFDLLLPRIEATLGGAAVEQLLERNPARAFTARAPVDAL